MLWFCPENESRLLQETANDVDSAGCVSTIKKRVRGRDGHKCANCGMTQEQHQQHYDQQLHVHRLIPGSVYHPSGCITLCRGCHKMFPASVEEAIRSRELRFLVFNLLDREDAALHEWLLQTAFDQKTTPDAIVKQELMRLGQIQPSPEPVAIPTQTVAFVSENPEPEETKTVKVRMVMNVTEVARDALRLEAARRFIDMQDLLQQILREQLGDAIAEVIELKKAESKKKRKDD